MHECSLHVFIGPAASNRADLLSVHFRHALKGKRERLSMPATFQQVDIAVFQDVSASISFQVPILYLEGGVEKKPSKVRRAREGPRSLDSGGDLGCRDPHFSFVVGHTAHQHSFLYMLLTRRALN